MGRVPPLRPALASGAVSKQPDGINVTNVTDWFVANVPGVTTPLTFTLIAGGRSNLTFRVEDASGIPTHTHVHAEAKEIPGGLSKKHLSGDRKSARWARGVRRDCGELEVGGFEYGGEGDF